MKHAYLIIAHNKYSQLQLLINLLDDARNDIYLHIDKKSELPKLTKPHFSKLIILDKRIDTRWGDISQVEVELLLLKTAYYHGPYAYYHLLSGIDLPIKSNDYIHNFFKEYNGLEFIGYIDSTAESDYYRRCTRYHLFTRHYKSNNIFEKVLWTGLRLVLEYFVNIFPKHFPPDLEIKCGSNWVSITNECCEYLISKEDFIMNIFKHSCCSDELFVQTIIWNSDFKYKIFVGDAAEYPYEHSIRLIDMSNKMFENATGGGTPYVLGSITERAENDLNVIKKTNCLFARNF